MCKRWFVHESGSGPGKGLPPGSTRGSAELEARMWWPPLDVTQSLPMACHAHPHSFTAKLEALCLGLGTVGTAAEINLGGDFNSCVHHINPREWNFSSFSAQLEIRLG